MNNMVFIALNGEDNCKIVPELKHYAMKTYGEVTVPLHHS
jgi:hypothetical protein